MARKTSAWRRQSTPGTNCSRTGKMGTRWRRTKWKGTRWKDTRCNGTRREGTRVSRKNDCMEEHRAWSSDNSDGTVSKGCTNEFPTGKGIQQNRLTKPLALDGTIPLESYAYAFRTMGFTSTHVSTASHASAAARPSSTSARFKSTASGFRSS